MLAVLFCLLVYSPVSGQISVFPQDLAGFEAAAGELPTKIDFDSVTPGVDLAGTELACVSFSGAEAPLVVVRGEETFTPDGFTQVIDPTTNKLFPTTGENVLSPGGLKLGPGPDPPIEDDDLMLVFPNPVSAFGFDHLSQSADGVSFTSVRVRDADGRVLFSGTLPISDLGGGGAPGGADFWGIVSSERNIKTIVLNEKDDDTGKPDANIGIDTLRFRIPPSENPCSLTFDGPDFRGFMGFSVAVVRDLDGDGFDDLAFGSPFSIPGVETGRVFIVSGRDGLDLFALESPYATAEFGFSLAGGVDLDGDGVGDLAVGAPDGVAVPGGAAAVFSGSGELMYEVLGPFNSRAGTSVSFVGDVDGDSIPDLLVGAPETGVGIEAGAALLVSGSDGSMVRRTDGDVPFARFGAATAAAGDLNQDGTPDYVVGAPGYDAPGGAGYVIAISGTDGSTLYRWDTGNYQDGFGSAVSGGRDVNGDGVPDVVVGAPTDANELAQDGSAWVFSGADGSVLHQFAGHGTSHRLGSSLKLAEDLDDDGYSDIVVGVPGFDAAEQNAGAVVAFSGRTGRVIGMFSGVDLRGRMGESLDVGRAPCPGVPMIVAGAPNADRDSLNSGAAYAFCVK